jgi:hypothetical protein
VGDASGAQLCWISIISTVCDRLEQRDNTRYSATCRHRPRVQSLVLLQRASPGGDGRYAFRGLRSHCFLQSYCSLSSLSSSSHTLNLFYFCLNDRYNDHSCRCVHSLHSDTSLCFDHGLCLFTRTTLVATYQSSLSLLDYLTITPKITIISFR